MAAGRSLRDRVVLITGAAHGIGLETARRCAAAGAHVAIVDIDGDAAREQAKHVAGDCVGLPADVTKRSDLDDAVTLVVERFGGLDAVVANAGVGRAGALSTMDEHDYHDVIAVNLDGTWNTVRATLPHLLRSRGYMLLMASAYAFMNGVGVGAYPVTKAGVEAMGRALRVELASQGVDVGVAYFGFVDTDLVRTAFAHPGIVALRKALPRFLVEPIDTGRVAAALARGIEQRRTRVTAPGWIAPGLALRGLVSFGDRLLAHDRRIQRAVALLASDDAS
jgi:NAD(P)-dependent dehydrogenase (short-subunit alcohol dehydrogenase family)